MTHTLLALLIFYFCILSWGISQPMKGKMGTHPDDYRGISLISPNVAYSMGQMRKISVPDTNAPWSINVSTEPLQKTAEGWPQEDFQVIFFDHRPVNAWANNNTGPCDDPNKYVVDLTGTYVLSFNGLASISSWCDHPDFLITNTSYNPETNTSKMNLEWGPGEGIVGSYAFMMLNFYNTRMDQNAPLGSGVTNIKLIRPGYPEYTVQPFRTEFLNSLSPFQVARFMTFCSINNQGPSSYLNPQPNLPNGNRTEWNDRQMIDVVPYSKGAPWESVIDLCNMAKIDAWICIPHAATDDYVLNLAKLFKDKLRPELKIYIEYSNEVWNPDFTQYQYNVEFTDNAPETESLREGATYGGTYWTTIAQPRRVAQRLIQMSEIFANEFNESLADRNKIRPVFCWQVGSGYGRERYLDVLKWIDQEYGTPKDWIYALGTAPYFNDRYPESGMRAQGPPENVVNVMQQNSDNNAYALNEVAGYALEYGIEHFQYEGGPDNGGPFDNMNNLSNRINANRIEEMGDLVYRNYTINWLDASVIPNAAANTIANYFVLASKYSRYGCWGSLEDMHHMNEPDKAPKYQAILALTGADQPTPDCAIININDGDSLAIGKEKIWQASASHVDGIDYVEFFIGSTLYAVDSLSPYEVSWTPDKEGVFALSAKAVDVHGFYTFSSTANVFVSDGPTFITLETDIVKPFFHLYPIPSSDELNIDFFDLQQIESYSIDIYSSTGRLLNTFRFIGNEPTKRIDISQLTSGMYFCRISNTTKNISGVRSFLVKK